jgi:hypothetical protein
MQVEIFTLCEDVVRREDGAYIAVNPFDTFRASAIPHTHDKCFIFGRVRFDKAGSYHIKSKLVDRYNKLTKQLFEGAIEVDESPEHSGSATFSIQLDNLIFDMYGKYSIVLFIKEEKIFTIPCFVALPSLPNISRN